MNLLKHILLVIALLVMAMPCTHADHVAHHDHHDRQEQMCSSHVCTCHSCEQTPCSDELENPLHISSVLCSAPAPAVSVILFVFSETKPVVQQVPFLSSGSLASIRTVRLLI